MKRVLVFVGSLAGGLALLLSQTGGLRGPAAERPEPVLRQAEPERRDGGGGAEGSLPGPAGLRVRVVDGPRYSIVEPRTFRDPRTGESVELPYFVSSTFEAAAGRPLPGPEGGAVRFDDVVVRSFRGPATLEEARRLRADPRSLESLLRLELFARHARADGLARDPQAGATAPGGVRDARIRLEGDVAIHDVLQHVWMRGSQVLFDPQAGRAEGPGRFRVEHEAWVLEGEDLVLVRDDRIEDLYRVDVRRNVLFSLRDAVAAAGDLGGDGPEAFRPSRVLARRATVLHDAGAGRRLHVALEGDVRALQQGGRRLASDRLRLTLEERAPTAGERPAGWSLLDLEALGAPVRVEVPDLATEEGARHVQLSARRLVREGHGASSEAGLVLEGDPVVLLEGELALPGVPGSGRWIRASARDRAVLTPVAALARRLDGSPAPGRRLLLEGAARLERGPGPEAPFDDVLEGDAITLSMRREPAGPAGALRDVPVEFAAEGQVVLAGTRVQGQAVRLSVQRLDTPDPLLVVEGPGTRLALLGLSGDQRLLGSDAAPEAAGGAPAGPAAPPQDAGLAGGGPPPGTASAPRAAAAGPAPGGGAQAAPDTGWTIDRVEAVGRFNAQTLLGGPVAGLPAWVEADRAFYERLSGRTRLVGLPGHPASVRVEAGPGRLHRLTAPTLAFEQRRARVEAEGGTQGEVWLEQGDGETRPLGLGDDAPPRSGLRTLTLETDERIEVQFRLTQRGGDPALGAPQVLRVLGPFTAWMSGGADEAPDRVRADRLELAFARRVEERTPTQPSAPTARVAPAAPSRAAAPPPHPRALRPAPDPRRPAPGPAARSAPTAERYAISSERLVVDLAEGRLSTFDAQGRVLIDSERLHVTGETLHFERRVGALILDGGDGRARARLGAPPTHSELVARALRVLLADDGPRWILASAPAQAVLVQPARGAPGESERYEVDCEGDVRITRTELLTQGRAWIRRTTRPSPSAPWGDDAQIWADRLTVQGTNLLAGGLGTAPPATGRAEEAERRTIETVVAEGPDTTLESGTGDGLIRMVCERLLLNVPAGSATLVGRPGRDVYVHRAGHYDVELERAVFDFRTRQIDRIESGSLVLRRGR